MKRTFALLLALALLLSGCSVFPELPESVAFGDMEYTRPDMTRLDQTLQAVHEALDAEASVKKLMDKVFDFYGFYYDFYTAYALSDIHYCTDMTDLYWQEEYEFCLDASTQVDAALDELLYALADCPLVDELEAEEYFGAGFFDDYQGESLWDEEFSQLMNQDAELQSQYYDLSAQAMECSDYDEYYNVYGSQMAELYAKLVKLRHQIADHAGYASYPAFAYDFYFQRDYTPDQAAGLLEDIQTNLQELYIQTAYSDVWEDASVYCREEDTFDYVADCAEAMGGMVAEAFQFMDDMELYNITYSDKKYPASFTTYILNYDEPYVFVDSTLCVRDRLTFTHEFGHFCNDYASYGSNVGIDVAEIFSQGLEYLSLCYAADGEDLISVKMADGLCVYVEQAAYAEFENRAYALPDSEVTVENLRRVFSETLADFGLDVWQIDDRGFVDVPHFFTNPLYVISYVVSNDAALQLYQMEQEEKGSGLNLYQEQLSTEVGDLLAFLESAGLESPFAPGRMAAVRDTLAEALGVENLQYSNS